jgi:serine/threonine protein kinase
MRILPSICPRIPKLYANYIIDTRSPLLEGVLPAVEKTEEEDSNVAEDAAPDNDNGFRAVLLMELIEGIPMADLEISTKRQALALAKACFTELAIYHAAGIAHRDIKPANVMIRSTSDPDVMIARLIDFGFATQLPQSDTDSSVPAPAAVAVSASATVAPARPHLCLSPLVGTALYLSPEQARVALVDKSHTLSAKTLLSSDVWAMTVSLVETICGSALYNASSVLSGSTAREFLVQHLLTHLERTDAFCQAIQPRRLRSAFRDILAEEAQRRDAGSVLRRLHAL